ncbi:MAG: diadenylate cyclase CdaA [Ignavibacteriales bacterium]|nr:diadenylate cyclase CdaA [Ignavibacteriales bacterium]
MFEIFNLGFLSFTFLDLLDLIIVTYIIYKIYILSRGSIAAQIFIGLIVVVLLSLLAQLINLKALGFILKLITDIWVIAFIILFQPEIRRILVQIGRTPAFKFFFRTNKEDLISILSQTAYELSNLQHGALIVVVKSVGIKAIAETGITLRATISKELLKSIFYPKSPLHDGAAIVQDNLVLAARCTLPLSSQTTFNGVNLGMRHRAGLGISEEADVVTVIVSEESGIISLAEKGILKRELTKDILRTELINSLSKHKEFHPEDEKDNTKEEN